MIQEQISLVKVRNGEDGENGLTSYVHVAWANSSDGRKDFSLTESLGKKYEGTYTDFTEGTSTDPSKYKWIESANVFREEIDEAKQAGYEANDKAYEAKIEAESASDNANNAVSKANDASADAGFAKDTANEAKTESGQAVESANSAVNKANSAVDDAGFAKNTADEAKSIADKAGEQAGEAKSSASKAIEDAKISLEKSDSNEKTITDVSKTVDTVKGELSSKASQTDYDTLKETVSDQSTSIKQNAKDIKLKANSQDVDTLNETVKNHNTEISQNAKAIKTKADQSYVDNISGEVESISTAVEQQAGRIETVSSKTDGNTTAIGKIESSYDGLKSTVSEVKDDVETAGGKISTLEQNLSGFKTTVQNEKADQSYVDNISGEVETLSTTVEQQAGKIETVSSKTGGNTTAIGKIESSYDGLKSTVSEVKDDVKTAGSKISTLEQNLSGFKTTVQNDKADKTTVTQLADQWQQTTDLVDGHTSQISSLGDNINLRVKKNDVINQINISDESILIDSAKTHITGKTTIEEGVIDTAYIKDAAITSAKIKDITADKIKAGEVSGLILTSLSETGRFSVEGQHATLENTDTGWKTDIYDNGIYTYNPDHSLRARFTEDIVNSNKFGTSSYNVYLATGGLDGVEGEAAGGEVRAVLYTQNIEDGEDVGSKYEYTYRPFRGEGMVGSYVNLNTAIPGSNNMYLRVPSGKEVKITRIGTVDDFQDIRAKDGYFGSIMQESSDANNFYIGANGEVRMTSRSGYNGGNTVYRDIRAQDARIASILQKDSGTNFYLGTGGKLRVTSRAGYNGGNTKYKAVQASGFENKSIVDIKTDITKRQEKALTCVNATDVYNYKLKDDVSRGITKNHIGLIIGDGYNTPDCVKNDDGTAIDIYAMTSVAWKAIQELSDKNETLNNRISDLQSEIDILRKETTI
ncbi:hypothetical protein HXW74_02620 [Tetragenococcus halophilus]|uniref:hypothetical protein n=1 Tax=Tetragenococcus halophilus TaxID=51669 RepID=UPI00209A9C27|nr:hypothetical protein [Tetragenococcus halophilus]MCO8288315.1 hypothetical protein [Tetragenococcus halophilus]